MVRKLSSEERRVFAEHLMEWGNLVFVGLVITVVFDSVPFALARLVLGVLSLAVSYWIAIQLMRGGE